EWIQLSKLYGLSANNCWKYLLRCISPSVRGELTDYLETEGLLLHGTTKQLLTAAEHFLRSAFDVTNDPVRFRNRLALCKQRSNELIGDYIGRLRDLLTEGKCVGVYVSSDELLDRFVKGLRPNYVKAVRTTYSHVRDVNQLCTMLTLWESANSSDSISGSSAVADSKASAASSVNVVSEAGANPSTGSEEHDSDRVNGSSDSQVTSGSTAPPVHYQASYARAPPPRRPVKCWDCGGPHMKRDCPFRKAQPKVVATDQPKPAPTVDRPAPTADGPALSQQSGNFELVRVLVDDDGRDEDVDLIRRVKIHEPLVSLVVRESGKGGARVKGLLDTGARGEGYMAKALFTALKSAGVIVGDLKPCSGVRFGNSSSSGADGEILLSVDGYGPLSFKVLPCLDPEVIIGMSAMCRYPTLRMELDNCFNEVVRSSDEQADRVDDVCDRLFESENALFVERAEDGRYEIRCPPLETASIFPHIEPPRRRSLSKAAIIDRWISIAARLGRFEEVAPSSELFISEVVLVAKTNIGAVDPSTLSDEQIRKHFRVTLDLRKVNSLKLYEQGPGNYVWLADEDVGKATPSAICQSQESALSMLMRWPLTCRGVYFKLDISDAFGSVYISKPLRYGWRRVFLKGGASRRGISIR
ncbi:hypothetical protein FOZ63_002046, partial [Perkinsus olseni]